ncbi:hypothetical protein DFJ74DRAFT_767501 [Hyaloraphidium curvatum]|nr:hypothetical protein DFJ74DRAFT_767501 [Hyaloraphidium curvatum]
MPRAAAALLLVAPAVHAAPTAGDRGVTLFVRSCSDCLEGSFCEFGHPAATAEAPIACVDHAGDLRSLYRRYAPASNNCFDKPGITTKFYGATGACFNPFLVGPIRNIGVYPGTCPFVTSVGTLSLQNVPNAPGDCVPTTSSSSVKFGAGCNSVDFFSDDACTTFAYTATITDPFP